MSNNPSFNKYFNPGYQFHLNHESINLNTAIFIILNEGFRVTDVLLQTKKDGP